MEEAVKRYLAGLLSSHRFNKTTLAKAMDTSRGHLDEALEGGRLTVKHINGIAAATTGKVSSVLSELYEFAKELEAEIIDESEPTHLGDTVHLGKRSYVTPRVRSEKAEIQRERAPLSPKSRHHRRR